jgi:alkanesulfonate monooxygenase SsuD/methylene tetrahydromethanopterin reductase-like flavin-dependent oxidoreductase (luciferase family)
MISSAHFSKPQELLSISVLCADTEEKAAQMRKLSDYFLLQFEKGKFEPIGPYEAIKDYRFSQDELERIQHNKGRIISGTPDMVKEQLTRLANDFDVEEIIVATMTYSQVDRVRSFELLAEAFGLEGRN